MKKLRYILLSLLIALPVIVSTGCERDYDDPKPERVFTDDDITAMGYEIISIRDLKQMYFDEYGQEIGLALPIIDKYAIKGKVISSDKQNNVYRVIYIQDQAEDGRNYGIEIKVGTYSNYVKFTPGRTVYVLAKGLVLGNYRFNLSLGFRSSDNSDYANTYLDEFTIGDAIKLGPATKLEASDTTVVQSPDQLNDNMLGSLVRFERVKSRWGIWDGDTYPQFLQQDYSMDGPTQYTNRIFATVIEEWKEYLGEYSVWVANGRPQGQEPEQPESPRPATLEYPTYAYSYANNKYYGSAWFEFGAPHATDPTHNLILRSSGHASFALYPVLEDGAEAEVTAIYNKYSSRTGGFITYQLLLNEIGDLKVLN